MPRINPQARSLTLALFIARKRVIDELRASGIKPQYCEPAEITKAANAYLEVAGAELIAQAEAILCRNQDIRPKIQRLICRGF
jgi:hypothetical protein